MEVNLTFVVQIVNFLIFCACTTRIFLRPFVRYIQEQSAAHDMIDADFAAKEAKLKDLVHAKGEMQEHFRVMLHEKYEIIETPLDRETIVEKVEADFSLEEKEDLRGDAVEYVTARIKNAYRA